MASVLQKRAGSWGEPAESGGREASAITTEYVASIRVVDVIHRGWCERRRSERSLEACCARILSDSLAARSDVSQHTDIPIVKDTNLEVASAAAGYIRYSRSLRWALGGIWLSTEDLSEAVLRRIVHASGGVIKVLE